MKPSAVAMRKRRLRYYEAGQNYRGEVLRQPNKRQPDELRNLWKADRKLYHKAYHAMRR